MKAKINILITDMGNGGAFCGNCSHDLDHGDPTVKLPKSCPKCGCEFAGKDISEYDFGGSDF